MQNNPTREIDVRRLISEGVEPFSEIMRARAELRDGESLLLIAPFEPKPLFPVFQGAGYRIESNCIGPDEWHVLFSPARNFDGAGGEVVELDVRELLPPAPLQVSLEALARLRRKQTLKVSTRFRPVHLLEALEGKGYDWDCEETTSNHWVTHIWRAAENVNEETPGT